jgi:hypothetical protein
MIAKLHLDLAEDDHPASLVANKDGVSHAAMASGVASLDPPEIACANNLLNPPLHYATVIAEL